MNFYSLLCGVALLALSNAQCNGTDLNNWAVDYTGSSAKFEFYSVCEKDKAYVRIEFKDMIEYGADGKDNGNKLTAFKAKAEDSWEVQRSEPYNGIPALRNRFVGRNYEVGKNKDKVNVTIETILFQGEGSVSVNNGQYTQTVYGFQLKFNVVVDGWPWIDGASYAQLNVEAETKEIKSKEKDPDTNKKSRSYVLGESIQMDVPDNYLCGSALKDVTTNVTGAALKVDVYFNFAPCPNETMNFDPFVYGLTTSAANMPLFTVGLIVAALFNMFM